MSTKSNKYMSLAGAVAMAAGMALGATQSDAQTRGGKVIFASQAEAGVIGHPPTMRRVNDSRPAATALETLLRFDEQGLLVPWLVTEWSEDANANTVTLKIRSGVKFHDGAPLDAEAVKWNLEQYKASDRPEFKRVSSIDVVDTQTLRLNLETFDNTILNNLAGTPGFMISPSSFADHGQEWAQGNPVGTGPFKFVSWEKDVRQVYERNEDYWQAGKPYLDGIEWQVITDPVTLTSALRAKEVHVYAEISPADAQQFVDNDDFIVSRAKVGVGGFGILFDSKVADSPFSDVRVRRAAIHAIDTKTIVDRLTRGLFDHTNQLVAPAHWGYSPDVKGYPYDPEKAKALLSEAGFQNGFETKLTSWNTPPLTVDAFTAVQGYLKEVGIDAKMELVDGGQLVAIVVGGEWEGLMWAAPGAPNPDAPRAFLADLSESSPLWKLVDHPEDYEGKLAEAISAPTFDEKRKLTWELQEIFFDKYALMIPLWSRADLAAKDARLHGDGLYTINRTQWTPDSAWLEK